MKIVEETREFTVTTQDGEQIKIMGKVITTTDGFDKDGNPKRSVEIKVPTAVMGAVGGQNG